MDRFFGLSDSGTTFGREVFAGVSTPDDGSHRRRTRCFFRMPAFPSKPALSQPSWRPPSAIMGLWAKWPVAVAPAWGQCLFCLRAGFGAAIQLQQALTAVFIASVLFLLFSLSRLRSWLISHALRAGITAGIGLFLAMTGFRPRGCGRRSGYPLKLGAVDAPQPFWRWPASGHGRA